MRKPKMEQNELIRDSKITYKISVIKYTCKF